MHVDSTEHAGAHVFDGTRVSDPSRVVVDEVLLKLLHLVIREHHLSQLTNASVHAIHDFVRINLALQHRSARANAVQRVVGKLHLFPVSRYSNDIFDSKTGSSNCDSHAKHLMDHVTRKQLAVSPAQDPNDGTASMLRDFDAALIRPIGNRSASAEADGEADGHV